MFKKVLSGFLIVVGIYACQTVGAGNRPGAGPHGSDPVKSAPKPSAPFVPDEVLVCFAPHTDLDSVKKTAARFKLTIIKAFNTPGLFLMRITDKSPVALMIKRLQKDPLVTSAEPNYIVSGQNAPLK